ncbi:MAG: hypothetical protein ACOCX5_03445, partial [Chloroflexota bacterium]
MNFLTLQYRNTITLEYGGMCSLLGVSPDGTIFVDQYPDDTGDVVRLALHDDGVIQRRYDETQPQPGAYFDLPDGAVSPRSASHTRPINYSGPRLRGLRATDRIAELAQSLTIAEKMRILESTGLKVMPP